MYFRMLHDEASGAMSYLLADPTAREAVLIDPRGSDVAVLRAMLDEYGLRLRWVLRTHEHDDRLPAHEVRALDGLGGLGATRVEHEVPVSDVLVFGDEHVQVIATPGHTAGCLSYRWRDRLFCGGVLAVDACPYQPRPVLPEALWDSAISRVLSLPAETLLFSGHARRGRAVVGTVLEQRRWHPWFGNTSRDEFLARVAELPADPPAVPEERHRHAVHVGRTSR
jgi:glyoxylase-like metal-dependent hydrolase (beta-lactamase superfamily II)